MGLMQAILGYVVGPCLRQTPITQIKKQINNKMKTPTKFKGRISILNKRKVLSILSFFFLNFCKALVLGN